MQIVEHNLWKASKDVSKERNLVKKYKKIIPSDQFEFYKQFKTPSYKRGELKVPGIEQREFDHPRFRHFFKLFVKRLMESGFKKNESLRITTRIIILFGLSDVTCRVWKNSKRRYQAIIPKKHSTKRELERVFPKLGDKNAKKDIPCQYLDPHTQTCTCDENIFCQRLFQKLENKI